MTFMYACTSYTNVYKFENDEVERILSCKFSVVCYI